MAASYKDKRQPIRPKPVTCRRCGGFMGQMDKLVGSDHYICAYCISEMGLQRVENKNA